MASEFELYIWVLATRHDKVSTLHYVLRETVVELPGLSNEALDPPRVNCPTGTQTAI